MDQRWDLKEFLLHKQTLHLKKVKRGTVVELTSLKLFFLIRDSLSFLYLSICFFVSSTSWPFAKFQTESLQVQAKINKKASLYFYCKQPMKIHLGSQCKFQIQWTTL